MPRLADLLQQLARRAQAIDPKLPEAQVTYNAEKNEFTVVILPEFDRVSGKDESELISEIQQFLAKPAQQKSLTALKFI